MERGAARRQDRQLRRAGQELADDGRRGAELLEVVEDEQDAPAGEVIDESIDRRSSAAIRQAQHLGDRRRHERRIRDGLERDEPDAVRKGFCAPRGELEAEPRLAGAARSGQGQEASPAEQRSGLVELLLPADKSRELGGQVVRSCVERTDRRKVRSQPVDDELAQTLGPEVLQAMFAKGSQQRAVRQAIRDERRRRLRKQDLAAVAGGRNTCRPVDVVAHVASIREDALAGVDAHPNPNFGARVPRLRRERALGVRGGAHRRHGPFEDSEERIALGPDLDAVGRGKRRAEDRAMTLQQLAVTRGTQRLAQARRALDIGEKERHRPDGELSRTHVTRGTGGLSDGAVAP